MALSAQLGNADDDHSNFQSLGSAEFECTKPLAPNIQSDGVKRAQAKYASLKNFSASFVQDSALAAMGESEQSAGTVWYKSPAMMRWNYVTPLRQEFVVKDRTVWLYQAAENQVIVDEISRVVLSDLPVSFLLGVGDLSKDFSLMDGCRTARGTALTFAPAGAHAEDNLQSFSLALDNDFLPVGAKVSDVGGNVTLIVLKQIKTDQPDVAMALFNPSYPTGADVSDRRKGVSRTVGAK